MSGYATRSLQQQQQQQQQPAKGNGRAQAITTRRDTARHDRPGVGKRRKLWILLGREP